MGIQINGQTDTISSTDGSLNIGGTVTVNVTGDATGLTGTPNITVGIVTASNVVVSGDLTVNGTTTTLDTVLTEVDKLEVGANNTTVGVAITQSGSGDILRLYDGGTQVVTVKDGGSVGIGTDNPSDKLSIWSAPNALVLGAKDTTRGNHIFQLLADDLQGHGELRLYRNSGSGTHEKTVEIASNGISYLIGGNVGINTTVMDANLEVHTSASKINAQTIKTSAGAGGYAGLAFMAGQTSAGREKAALYFQETNGGAHYTGDLVFALNSNSGSAAQVSTSDERLRITSSGNVGINTTTFPANGTNLKVSNGTISRLLLDKTGTDARSFSIGNIGTHINLYDETAGVERLRITSDGQLRSQATYNGSSSTSNTFPALNLNNLQSSYTANNIIGGVTFGKAPGHTNGIRAGMLALYAGTGSLSDNIGTNLVFRTAAESGGDSQERLRIDSSGRVTTPYQPAFRATFPASYTVATNTEMVPSTIVTNIGSHYSNTTGRFTAPVSGMYHFSFNVRFNAISYYNFTFRVNSNVIQYYESVGSTGASVNHGNSHSIYLSAGDYVSLFNGSTGGLASDSFASFSGFLIG